jgi:hypothetical protein
LPSPGTSIFVSLYKKLNPYGISTAGVSLDAPTNKLSDIVLNILLLEDQVNLRFTYNSVEISHRNIGKEDFEVIDNLYNTVISVLSDVDPHVSSNRLQIVIYSHLSLLSYSAEAFLQDHLKANKNSRTIPDAFAYQLLLSDSSKIERSRIVVAKSQLAIKNGIFIELNLEYSPSGLFSPMQILKDYVDALGCLNLKESPDSE